MTQNQMQKDNHFYKRIVQIEFNAWHYVDVNLWACLVEHIFDNLRVLDEDEEDISISQELKTHLINQLISVEKEKVQAQAKVNEANAELTKTQTEINVIQKKLDKQRTELEKISKSQVLQDFMLTKPVQELINNIRQEFGLEKVSDSAKELQTALEEVRGVVGRSSALITALTKAPDHRRRFQLLLISLLAGPMVALITAGLALLSGNAGFSQFLGFITGVTTFLTTVAVWVRQQATWFSGYLNKIEEARKKVDQQITMEQADLSARIKNLEQELQQLQTNYDAALRRNEEAQRQVDQAKTAVEQATAVNLLATLIQDRAESTDYRKHLGLLSLVRNDFEKISGLIEEENWRLAPVDSNEQANPNLPAKFRNLEEEDKEKDKRINRIVLYIDDLDRCIPKTVVEVLQAVHLLLAFPLFVVVVGVDSRWIIRSLQTRYKELLHTQTENEGVPDIEKLIGVATPGDYLEKIFQIPFWLKPLNPESSMKMVQGLLKGSLAIENLPAESLNNRPEANGEMSGDHNGTQNDTGIEKPEPELLTPFPIEPKITSDPNPESLVISQNELAFMKELAPLLGRSPRALKRFVNVYRLIKVGLSPQEYRAFQREGKSLSDYKAVCYS